MIINNEILSCFSHSFALIIEQLGAANWERTGSIIQLRKSIVLENDFCKCSYSPNPCVYWFTQITVDGRVDTDPNTILRFFYRKYDRALSTNFVLEKFLTLLFVGWILFHQITRVGSELVYHRLPWREPEAPYLLEVLYEDDDMVCTPVYAIFLVPGSYARHCLPSSSVFYFFFNF